MARWYIEAKEGESWRDVSSQFGRWIPDPTSLGSFGWHEGDPVDVGEKKLYCFDIPNHHRNKVDLFERWAKTTQRLYGYAKGGKLLFPNEPNLTVALPAEPRTPVPPWLR
jgi:hypothetical protein